MVAMVENERRAVVVEIREGNLLGAVTIVQFKTIVLFKALYW